MISLKYKLKAIFATIFITWWWGFWKRKPKGETVVDLETGDLHFEAQPVDPQPPETIGDLIKKQMNSVSSSSDASIPRQHLNPYEDWKDKLIWLAGSGEKKVRLIKFLRALTGLGLKETKAFVDNSGSVSSFLGPFRDSPGDILNALDEIGAEAYLCEVDLDDGQVKAVEGQDEWVPDCWSELCQEKNPDPDDFPWLEWCCLSESSGFYLLHHDNYKDNEAQWYSLFQQVDPSEEPEEFLDEEPEEIFFGHEDAELYPK